MKERKILRHVGKLIDSRAEMSHVTQYYRVRPGSMMSSELECSSRICRSSDEPVTVIRYEKDHRAKEFIDAFCNVCAPAMYQLILKDV